MTLTFHNDDPLHKKFETTICSSFTSYGHIKSQNKIFDFLMILARLCRFNLAHTLSS